MCLADLHVAGALARARIARKRSVLAAAAAATLALGFAACGDQDESPQTTAAAVTTSTEAVAAGSSGSASDSAGAQGDPGAEASTIEETLEAVLVGGDPSQACDALVTERFVRVSYGDQSGCEQAQSKKATADAIEISGAVVSGEHGQAQVKARGGVYDGQKLRAELVLDGQIWRLDSLRSNVPVGP
jgi:hypothetical protein